MKENNIGNPEITFQDQSQIQLEVAKRAICFDALFSRWNLEYADEADYYVDFDSTGDMELEEYQQVIQIRYGNSAKKIVGQLKEWDIYPSLTKWEKKLLKSRIGFPIRIQFMDKYIFLIYEFLVSLLWALDIYNKPNLLEKIFSEKNMRQIFSLREIFSIHLILMLIRKIRFLERHSGREKSLYLNWN